jgi:ribokinase
MDISVAVPALPAPGATVLGGAAAFAPGGKGANQAVAAARLGGATGCQVSMAGCVGDDEFGRMLRAALRREGVDDAGVRTVPAAPTGIAMITVDAAGENTITVAPGANSEAGAQEVAALRGPVLGDTVLGDTGLGDTGLDGTGDGRPDVLVVSAEVPVPAVLAALAEFTGGRAPVTVVNLAPAPARREALDILAMRPDWLIVNESEAAAVLGRPVAGLDGAVGAAADLVAAGARTAVVTAGAAGAACYGPGAGEHGSGKHGSGKHGCDECFPITVPAFAVQARDAVGAGDTFVGALAVAIAVGVAPAEAVTAACAAAATAVTRPGTQDGMPRPADIAAATGYAWPVATAAER